MRTNLGRALVAAVVVCVSGCYGTRFEGGLAVLPSAHRAADGIVIRMARDPAISLPWGDEEFVDTAERATSHHLDRSGLAERTVDERHLGRDPVEASHLVRYRLAGFVDESGENGGRAAAITFCSVLVLPCPLIGATPAYDLRISSTWEMLVYDVRGVTTSTVRDARTGDVVEAFDLTQLRPTFRRIYVVGIRASLGGPDYRDPARRRRVLEDAADELSARLVTASFDDLESAVAASPTETLAARGPD